MLFDFFSQGGDEAINTPFGIIFIVGFI